MIWRQLHRSLLRAFSCLVYLATATGPHHLTNCNKGHYLFHTLLSVIVISICAAQQCLPHVSSAFIAAQLVPFQPLEWVPVGNLCDFPAADCDEVIAVWTRGWQLTENWCAAQSHDCRQGRHEGLKMWSTPPPSPPRQQNISFSLVKMCIDAAWSISATKQPDVDHRCKIQSRCCLPATTSFALTLLKRNPPVKQFMRYEDYLSTKSRELIFCFYKQ